MPRGAKGTKPAKAKVEATRPVARKSRKNEGSRDHPRARPGRVASGVRAGVRAGVAAYRQGRRKR